MIDRNELSQLQQHRDGLMLSIIAPLEKVYPDSGKNNIMVKNLIREAETKLNSYFDAATVSTFIKKAESLGSELDLLHPDYSGIAFYISENTAKAYPLPNSPKQTVSLDHSFHTRDLVHAFYKMPRYLLVSMSKLHTILFRGLGPNIKEVLNADFPISHGEPSRTEPVGRTLRTDVEYEELEDTKIYVRKVADALKPILSSESTPLFVMGEKEYTSFLIEHTEAGKSVAGEIQENNNYLNAKELIDKVYPGIENYYRRDKLEKILSLEEMKGYNRYVGGIQNVWQAAVQGQVMTLLVENSYSVPARIGKNMELVIENDPDDSQLSDGVDELIEKVAAMNGEIMFVEDGQLHKHGQVAAILRYSA